LYCGQINLAIVGNLMRVLVTGAVGQIGAAIVNELRKRYGGENIVASGHSKQPTESTFEISGPFEIINVVDKQRLLDVIKTYNIDHVYHLAAVLSAAGEKNPNVCWDINVNGLKNVLDIAVELPLKKVFWASSAAVFGPSAPKHQVPQNVILDPITIYGTSKVTGEMLCSYYHRKYGVDVRSLRYPAIISHTRLPNGAAVDIFTEMFRFAASDKKYESYLPPDVASAVMYIDDTVGATLQLMDADSSKITVRSSYNIQSDSYSIAAMVDEIKKHVPNFVCTFDEVSQDDFRVKFLSTIPHSVDDSAAKYDWNWQPKFGLANTTKVLLALFGDNKLNL